MFLLLSERLLHFWLVWWELRLFVLQGWMAVIVDWISCTAVVEDHQLVKGPHLSELPCRACSFSLQCVSAWLLHLCVLGCFNSFWLDFSLNSAWMFYPILPCYFHLCVPCCLTWFCLDVSPNSSLLFHLIHLIHLVLQDSADEELYINTTNVGDANLEPGGRWSRPWTSHHLMKGILYKHSQVSQFTITPCGRKNMQTLSH